jgi:hypothetical protein
LLDIHGEVGRVSMSVVLVPFPKPASAANLFLSAEPAYVAIDPDRGV